MRAPSVARRARSGALRARRFNRSTGAFDSRAGGMRRFGIDPLGRFVRRGSGVTCPFETGLMLAANTAVSDSPVLVMPSEVHVTAVGPRSSRRWPELRSVERLGLGQ